LDGIVTLGGPQAIHVLKSARAKLSDDPRSVTAEWIDEAVEQLSSGFFKSK
jgi:hypothetical protein